MLTVTTDAAQAIQELVASQPGAGLRISPQSTDGDQIELGLAVTTTPEATDEVIEQEGCQVFLDEQVAPLLDGRTLDTRPTGNQTIGFTLLP